MYCISACVRARICVSSSARIFICFSRSSERDRFTDRADGVESTMLALSLFLSFCLVCSLSVAFSDKTSNCFNVVSVSLSLVNATRGERQEPGCGLNLRTASLSVKPQKRSKHQSGLILL